MISVGWLEQAQSDVAPGEEWLSSAEAMDLSRLRFAKRRADWLLGRWTAKSALALRLEMPRTPGLLAGIEIRAAADGAPEASVHGEPAPFIVSITHSGRLAACAIAPAGVMLGCDVETIERREPVFVADYFTAAEQERIVAAPEPSRNTITTAVWSAKESALKALRVGLRASTLSVEVTATNWAISSNWRPMQVRYASGQILQGWWREAGGLVRTTVACPASDAPAMLT